jgi:hypothetical protein
MARGIVVFDSGVIAAGAIIATPVLDVAPYERLLLVATNSSGASTRALTYNLYLDDGSTAVLTAGAIATVGTSSSTAYHIGPCSTSFDLMLPAAIKFTLAAAGSSNGRLTIFGR